MNLKIKLGHLIVGLAIFPTYLSAQQDHQRPPGDKRPSVNELFVEMDNNKDGRLSKEEVKGPLQNDFPKIDTNHDGFISKGELKKAPKPADGPLQGRPPQNGTEQGRPPQAGSPHDRPPRDGKPQPTN
jgi:hypothetical protein